MAVEDEEVVYPGEYIKRNISLRSVENHPAARAARLTSRFTNGMYAGFHVSIVYAVCVVIVSWNSISRCLREGRRRSTQHGGIKILTQSARQ